MQKYFKKFGVSLIALLTLFSSTGSSVLDVMAEEDSGSTDNSTEISGEEDGGSTSVESENTQVKGSAGKVTIETLNTEIFRGADLQSTDENGNKSYSWTAKSSAKGHDFAYRVNYATSGEGELEVDEFHFTMPIHVIKDKNGSWADEYEMSLPTEDEFEEAYEEDKDTFLAYREEDSDGDGVNDQLYVYNAVSVPAAISGYVEISYSTTQPTYNYIDGTSLSNFQIKLWERTVSQVSNICSANISTDAKISSVSFASTTQKRYSSWQSSWGTAIKPENADDYYYTVWNINVGLGTITQGYKLTLDSTLTGTKDNITIVGWQINGSSWQKENYVTNQTSDGRVYAAMITAYPKSEYDSLTSFSIKNDLVATVTPRDGLKEETQATTSKTFKWQQPVFNPPSGDIYNMWVHGNGTFNGSYWYDDNASSSAHYTAFDGKSGKEFENYQLEEFQKGELTELSELTFYAHNYNYYLKNTIKEGGSAKNPEDYFQKEVTVSLESGDLYLEDFTDDDTLDDDYKPKSNPLTSSDIRIDSIDWTAYNNKYTFNDEEQTFDASAYKTEELYYIYVKTGDSDEWTKVATYQPSTNTYEILNSDIVTSASGQSISFSSDTNVMKYKIETTNKCGYTAIHARAHTTLKNSETVMNYVKDKDTAYLLALGYSNFTSDGATSTCSKYDFDRIVKTQRNSNISKSVVGSTNSAKKKRYTISWKVNMNETITQGTGEVSNILQNGGTFYDLLPEGSTFNKDTVAVYGDGTVLGDGDYSVKVTKNYKNSGRILLTVKITKSANKYTIYYDTIHAWDTINDYGTNELNPVAYETGNESIAEGYYDDPTKPEDEDQSSALKEGDRKWFTGLSEDNSKARFIYTDSTKDIVAITSATTGLTKKVLGNDNDSYTYKDTTSIGATYSYRIRYQNTYTAKASNIMFFDSLENFVTTDGKSSAWHGTIQYIDVSQLESKDVDAKIYYSTIENLDLSENNDLTDTSVWALADENTDLSVAKAFAIDASKKTDGTDFVLEPGASLSAYVYMKAPDVCPDADGEYPTAYNNIYMHNTIQTTTGYEDFFIHQDYDQIKLAVTGNASLKKVNANNTDETLSGLQFRLTGTSDYGTSVDSILTTNSNGEITFEGIEKGTYTLSEYDATADWQLDYTPHTVVIDGSGNTIIDDVDYTNSEIVLTNKPRVHADISFNKKVLGGTKAVNGAQFKLSGTSDYGNDVLMYATSENGKVTFDNVELGTYTIVETKAPSGYVLDQNNKYTVQIDENAQVSWSLASGDEDTLEVSGGKATIYNESKHNVGIYKVNSYDYSAVSGVTFELVGTSDAGDKFDLHATTGESGLISFGGLESGTYALIETAVSDDSNVKLDTTAKIITIDKYGNSSIEGVEKDSLGNFIIVDTAKASKQVTVIKKWNDADGTSVDHSQSLPNIHIKAASTTVQKLNSATIEISDADSIVYTGEAQTPNVTVKNKATGDVIDSSNYTVSYSNNIHAGTATVTITGDGYNAIGTISEDFIVNPAPITVTTASDTKESYDGEALTNSTFDITSDTVSSSVLAILKKYTKTTGIERNPGTSKNTYVIDWTTLESENENISEGDFTIVDVLGILTVGVGETAPDLETTPSETASLTSKIGSTLASAFNFTTVNAEEGTTVTFDANGSTFEDGSTTNTINYGSDYPKVTKYSHTDNISDDGTQNSNYGNNEAKTEVVTIDGATSLTVTVTYGGESASYDWVSIFSGSHPTYTAASNYSSADIAQKLGGGSHTSQTKTYTVSGDSVTFAWKSDSSGYGDGYGYYAVVTATTGTVTGTYAKPTVPEGKKFIGWSTDKSAAEATYARDGSDIPTDQNLTLYAVYTNWQWCDDWDYKLDSTEKTIWIYKYNGKETDYAVPASATIDGVTYTTKIGYNDWNDNGFPLNTGVITNISFQKGVVTSTNLAKLFENSSNLTGIDVSNLDTSKVTGMSDMFYNCSKLTSLAMFENKATSTTASNYVWYKGLHNSELVNSTNPYSLQGTVLSKIKLKKGELLSSATQKIIADSAMTSAEGYTGNWTALSEYNHTHGSKLTTDITYNGNSYVSLNTAYASITDEEWEANPDGIWFVWEKEGEDPASQAYDSTSNFYTATYDDDGNLTATPEETYTEDGYWTKIDESTYAYTFYVYDNSVAWAVWEDDYEGYTSNATSDNPIIISSGEETATITNTANAIANRTYGNVTIVSNVNDPMNTHTEGYTTYTVTLTDENGNQLTGTKMYGDIPFKDGVAKVTVPDGGSVTIPNVPTDYNYTVTQDDTGYNSDSTIDNCSNTIPDTLTETVTVETNFPYVMSETSTGKFIVTNTVDGVDKDSYKDYEFNYVVTMSGLEAGNTYTFYSDESRTNAYVTAKADKTGDATVNMVIKDGEKVYSQDLPVGVTYVIQQNGATDFVTSFDARSSNGSVTSSHKANDESGNDLATNTETNEADETAQFDFLNTTAVKKDLHLTKKVSGSADANEEFEFTITMEGLEPKQVITSNEYGRFVADSDGYIEKTITLKADEELILYDVPSGTKYRVTETNNSKFETSATLNGNTATLETDSDKNDYLESTIAKTDATTEDVVWTNTAIQTYSVTYKKVVDGSMGNKYTEFEFEVQFDKDTRAGTTITAYNSEEGKNIAMAIDKNGVAKFTLHSGEALTFSGLTESEIQSMSNGATSTNDVCKTTIGASEKDYSSDGYTTTSVTDFDEDNDSYSVTYTNTKNSGVPTGNHVGTGAMVFGIGMLIGLAIILKKKVVKD